MNSGCSKTVELGCAILGNPQAWGAAGEGWPAALAPHTRHEPGYLALPFHQGAIVRETLSSSSSGICWVFFSLVILAVCSPIPQWTTRPALPPQSLLWPLPQCLSPSPVWPRAGWALGPATCNLYNCIIRDVRENYLGTWQAAGRTSRRIQTGTSATADVQSLAKRNHGGGLYPASSFHNSGHRQTTHTSSLLPTSFPGTNAHPDNRAKTLNPEYTSEAAEGLRDSVLRWTHPPSLVYCRRVVLRYWYFCGCQYIEGIHLHTPIHSSIVHNSQEMETTQVHKLRYQL